MLLELVRDEDPSLVEERQRDDGLGDSKTPMSRGQRPDSDALTGFFLKAALASAWAAFGLTVLPSRSLACMRYVSTARYIPDGRGGRAYCCTSWRYAVTGLSPTVCMAEPPRYAHLHWTCRRSPTRVSIGHR